jgi:hypothetical protein
MTPNFLFSFLTHEYKNYTEKVICPNVSLTKIEGKLYSFETFKTIKPNSQETAQNFEKHVLHKCLRIAFYT